ncbi:MAG: hypothetical protein ABIQ40_11095 [Bacteroidia bacterium]
MNILFTCRVNLNDQGTMTLNGLNKGYHSPPSGGTENPQLVMSYVPGNTVANVIQSCGGHRETVDAGSSYSGYGSTITYNLPDGSLLTIKYKIYYKPFTGYVIDNQVLPLISSDSLYEILNLSYSGSEHSGFTLSFTVQRQQN